MTCTLTADAMGQLAGSTYTGPEEDYLVAVGVAKANSSPSTKIGPKNTGAAQVVPAKDLTLAANRESPDDTTSATAEFSGQDPAFVNSKPDYDYDPAGVNNDAPGAFTLSPAAGPLAAGRAIVITGEDFTGATGVTFGGTAGTSFSVVDDHTIHVTTPTKTAGVYDVIVTNATGTKTQAGAYTAVALPTVTSISPTGGGIAGGTVVTATGTNLANTTGVTVGGVAATEVTNVSGTSVTFKSPAGTAGAKDVIYTTRDGGSVTKTGQFTYA